MSSVHKKKYTLRRLNKELTCILKKILKILYHLLLKHQYTLFKVFIVFTTNRLSILIKNKNAWRFDKTAFIFVVFFETPLLLLQAQIIINESQNLVHNVI